MVTRLKAIEVAVETLRLAAAEAGIEVSITFHADAVPALLPSLPERRAFVVCQTNGHQYCKSFDLAGACLIVSREATAEEVAEAARCRREEAKYACER